VSERADGPAFRVGFDVDDTLLDVRFRLRPQARDVFAELHSSGIDVFIWSGVGLRWEVAHVHDLSDYIIGCYHKPISLHRQRLLEHGVPFVPDFVVDDDVEVVRAFGGHVIPPPEYPLHEDRHLLTAGEAVLRSYRAFLNRVEAPRG
jgi:FMN phosphatase YigB (HAD superfamily)